MNIETNWLIHQCIFNSSKYKSRQIFIGNQKANRMTNYQILRVFHVQTLNAYCTSILRLITVIFCWTFRSSLNEEACKIWSQTDNSSLRYSVFKFMEIVKIFADTNFVRISRQIKLIFWKRVALFSINSCVKFQYQKT